MTAHAALEATRILITLAVLHHAVEGLILRRGRVWDWSIVRRDFEHWPAPARRVLDLLGAAPGAIDGVVALSAAASLVLPGAAAPLLPVLLAGTTVTSLQTRGTVGGASDCMTFFVLGALCLASLLAAPGAGLYAIAIQGCLSYFLAGVAKLRNPRWRSGAALHTFTRQFAPARHRNLLDRAALARAAGVGVIAFECSFPVALVSVPAAAALFIAGALFHLTNAHLLGLHRFILPWIATYPAILYVALASPN